MLDLVCEVASVVLAVTGIGLVLWRLLRRRRPASVLRCLARRGSPVESILPWRVFRAHACGYGLVGVPRDEDGLVTCPECGSRGRTGPTGNDWRWGRVSAALILVGVALNWTPSVVRGTWPGRLPTLAVVVGHRTLGDRLPSPVADELQTRLQGLAVQGVSAHVYASGAIADLRDDEVRWNLQEAMAGLRRLPEEITRPRLERALGSQDWQQRQAAASMLRRMTDPQHASDALLEVTVEGLRDDHLPRSPTSTTWISNASAGVEYLIRVGPRAQPWLREGIAGDDAQLRLLCSIAAGFAGLDGLADDAAPILVTHLEDNRIPGDARVCLPAIYWLGPRAAHHVLPHVDAQDEQLRGLCRALLDGWGVEYACTLDPDAPTPRVTGVVVEQMRNREVGRFGWWWLNQIE